MSNSLDQNSHYSNDEIDALISGEDLEGDTEQSEKDSQPEAINRENEEADKKAESESGDGEIDYDKLNADNAVVLTKDGKHTIKFEKHKEIRDDLIKTKDYARSLEAEIEQLRKSVANSSGSSNNENLESDLTNLAESQGVDVSIFGDFSEEAMVAGLNKLVDMKLEQHLKPIKEREEAENKKAQDEVAVAHRASILEAHPDADSISESQEFANWLLNQSSVKKSIYLGIVEGGTADEVVELLSIYKAENGLVKSDNDIKAKAREALNKAANTVPSSISDFAGGRNSSNSSEAIDEKLGIDLVDAFENMSPSQIEQHLNRNM